MAPAGWFRSPSRGLSCRPGAGPPCRLPGQRGERVPPGPPPATSRLTHLLCPPNQNPVALSQPTSAWGRTPGSRGPGWLPWPRQPKVSPPRRPGHPPLRHQLQGRAAQAREGVLTLTQGLGADRPAHLGPTHSLGPPWRRWDPRKAPSSSRLRMELKPRLRALSALHPSLGPRKPGAAPGEAGRAAAGATGGPSAADSPACWQPSRWLSRSQVAGRVLPDFRVGLTFLLPPRPPAAGSGEEPAQGAGHTPPKGLHPHLQRFPLEDGLSWTPAPRGDRGEKGAHARSPNALAPLLPFTLPEPRTQLSQVPSSTQPDPPSPEWVPLEERRLGGWRRRQTPQGTSPLP